MTRLIGRGPEVDSTTSARFSDQISDRGCTYPPSDYANASPTAQRLAIHSCSMHCPIPWRIRHHPPKRWDIRHAEWDPTTKRSVGSRLSMTSMVRADLAVCHAVSRPSPPALSHGTLHFLRRWHSGTSSPRSRALVVGPTRGCVGARGHHGSHPSRGRWSIWQRGLMSG